MSCVMCHLFHIGNYICIYIFFFKLVKLVGGGSLTNWAYPVVFISGLSNIYVHGVGCLGWAFMKFHMILDPSMYLARRNYVPDQEDFHISLLLADSPVRSEGIVVAVGGVTVNHL